MKQTKPRLLCLLLAGLLLLSLAACGKEKPVAKPSDQPADPNLIQLEEYELRYKSGCIMEDFEGKDALVLTLDFTNNSEENATYLWSVSDTATQNGAELEGTIIYTNNETLEALTDTQWEEVAPGATFEVQVAFVLMDTTSEVEVSFEPMIGGKSGKLTVDPSTLSRESSGGGEGQTAGTGDALLDWWNGDWYGWWMMTGCSGYYEEEDMEGQWWDVCGTIEIGEDYMGTVTLWDEDYTKSAPMVSASVSLSEVGTGQYGTLMSEGGSFTDVALEHADWIVDPGLLDYTDLIHIDGYYESGDDGYFYDIYLRPWGTYWDDMDQEDLPFYYDDWYLPLIDAGEAMPDEIGGGAPAGGGASTAVANPGGDVPGGDGIVSDEAVQKAWVYLSEVSENTFDTTYEELVDYFGVEGQFVKEEYSDHMQANYRYYKWISSENPNNFLYVNFKETEPGVFKISAYNTSGFSGSEAVDKYLDIVQAEAAQAG